MRSGLARPDVRYQPDVEQGWSALAGNILGHDTLTPKNIPFRMAVLQHYGLKTHYVDVTADFRVAAWFASNESETRKTVYGGTPFRYFNEIGYESRGEGIGYVLVLVLKDIEELKARLCVFDISTLGPFLRPQRQHAWLLRDRKPLLPDPNDFWSATIALDCSKFQTHLSTRHLFPPPREDVGYKVLLDLPCVEIPSAWLTAPPKEKRSKPERKKRDFEIDFGIRALLIPLYAYSDEANEHKTDEYNHKWNDVTLTEPKPCKCG